MFPKLPFVAIVRFFTAEELSCLTLTSEIMVVTYVRF
jgi:hypothetical protein